VSAIYQEPEAGTVEIFHDGPVVADIFLNQEFKNILIADPARCGEKTTLNLLRSYKTLAVKKNKKKSRKMLDIMRGTCFTSDAVTSQGVRRTL